MSGVGGHGQTMGETTRRRLAEVVRAAKQGDGGVIGRMKGFGGGGLYGGTWGKAPTGRSLDKPDVERARSHENAAPRPYHSEVRPSTGRRQSIRRNSCGAKNVWESGSTTSPIKGYGPQAFATRRPQSASATNRKSRPLMASNPDGYEVPVQGHGLQGVSTGTFSFAPPQPSDRKHTDRLMKASKFGTRDHEGSPEKPKVAGRPVSRIQPEDQISAAHLYRLEQEIRESLKSRRTVYEAEKDILKKLFRDMDDGSGNMYLSDFRSMMDQLGVHVSAVEAQAFFSKHGHSDCMPHSKLIAVLGKQPNKQMSDDLQVRKGAFVVGEKTAFSGRIAYPQCRSSVYTPSEWNPALAERSGEIPSARLQLEFVYGYAGLDNTSQNLFFTSTCGIAYYTAGIGVVLSSEDRQQRFFLGHNDDIKSMAVCSARVKHNGVNYPAKSLFATGQVTSQSGGPYVCIWDSRPSGEIALAEVARIAFDKEDRGIAALAFSPDGKKLVCVAMDNPHTVYVFDWRSGIRLSEGKGFTGEPPQVYGAHWDPFTSHGYCERFVTYGKKHAKIWQPTGENGLWQSSQLTFGKYPMQNVNSIAFLKPKAGEDQGVIVAGMAAGDLYVFKDGRAVKSIPAHRSGPKITAADGSVTFGGLRGMALTGNDSNLLITGGADGSLLWWDVSSGAPVEDKTPSRSIQLHGEQAYQERPPGIRAIDCHPITGEIVVGTNGCDIWRATDERHEVLVQGHSGDLYGISWHPLKPNIFATACDCSWISIWDANRKDIVLSANMGFALRTVCFSSAPVHGDQDFHHIAVGGAKGRIKVVHEEDLRPIFSAKDVVQGIADMKYSPNNQYLAVSSYDTFIDLYNVANGYSRVSRCVGHSATVRHLDWNVDSTVLQSNCAAYEILYWNPKTGKQVKHSQRDAEWATWTCVLGFPVMGIWPEYSDGTDVNSCDRSHNGDLLATSGDDGLVKLFNYPCVVEDAPYRAYRGHSSHVVCVRFNSNDTMVSSTGGKDRAIFQFRSTRIEPEAEPEPEAPPIWGPLDASGKSFGWVKGDQHNTTDVQDIGATQADDVSKGSNEEGGMERDRLEESPEPQDCETDEDGGWGE